MFPSHSSHLKHLVDVFQCSVYSNGDKFSRLLKQLLDSTPQSFKRHSHYLSTRVSLANSSEQQWVHFGSSSEKTSRELPSAHCHPDSESVEPHREGRMRFPRTKGITYRKLIFPCQLLYFCISVFSSCDSFFCNS